MCLRHAVNYRRCSLVRRRYSSVQMPATTNGENKVCAGKYQRAYYTYLPRAPHTRARTEYRRPASGCPRHNDVFPKNRVFPKKMVLLPSVVGAITTRTTESNQGRPWLWVLSPRCFCENALRRSTHHGPCNARAHMYPMPAGSGRHFFVANVSTSGPLK